MRRHDGRMGGTDRRGWRSCGRSRLHQLGQPAVGGDHPLAATTDGGAAGMTGFTDELDGPGNLQRLLKGEKVR